MEDGIVHWNLDPEIFRLTDSFPVQYYGLFWLIGLVLSYFIVRRIYKNEGVAVEKLDNLLTYIFIGIIVGARLAHCLFYDFEYYSDHVLEIFLPIQEVNGSYQFIGFRGLASHGGTFGVILAIYLYNRKYQEDLLWIFDRIAIGAAVTAAFIRLANLMNSEIYGKPTDGTWGFVFERDDMIPRHPTQIYEAFAYFLIFGILLWVYRQKKEKTKRGLLTGILLVLLFSARFVIEFFKENQSSFEDGMTLNMGQWLSIPFVIAGLIFIFRKPKNNLKV